MKSSDFIKRIPQSKEMSKQAEGMKNEKSTKQEKINRKNVFSCVDERDSKFLRISGTQATGGKE